MNDLRLRGCDKIVVVRDQDRDAEADIRAALESQGKPPLPAIVCIPVEELEAWFLCDPVVLHAVSGRKTKGHSNPHLVSDPKGELIRMSRDAQRRPRYSTNDNAQLAQLLNIDLCRKTCPSFVNNAAGQTWHAPSSYGA
jgi:Domain of unknown function (DUF4276)